MHHLLRAVGTQYVGHFIWRTYGTLNTMNPFFYPYNIPNGMILKDYTQCLKMRMNNARLGLSYFFLIFLLKKVFIFKK